GFATQPCKAASGKRGGAGEPAGGRAGLSGGEKGQRGDAMSAREVVFLGTASQVPTRTRNHNALVLLWDDLGILFDPGEGTQRQMTLAGLSAGQITHVAV